MQSEQIVVSVARATDLVRRRGPLANLSGADLRGAHLTTGANLREANLNRANLHGVSLHGVNLGRANLSGADLGPSRLSCGLLGYVAAGVGDHVNLKSPDRGWTAPEAEYREAYRPSYDVMPDVSSSVKLL
jgi:hypothetical protein